jgi:hypothetical protein
MVEYAPQGLFPRIDGLFQGDKQNDNSLSFQLSCMAHAAALYRLYSVPKAKLIFCGIPKVGILEWIKFFRHTYGAGDYLSIPYFKDEQSTFGDHASNVE